MSSLKDLASLIMIPSLVKDGRLDTVKPLGNSIIHPDATGNNDGTDGSTPAEGNFTFTRGSNLSATRVNASQLIEKGRENVFTYSNDFSNSAWNLKAGTFTQGVEDPNGGNTAWSWTAQNTDPYIYQQLSVSGVYTLSIYAKGVGSTIGANFQLRNAASTPNFTLTNEWQRFEIYNIPSNSNLGFEFGNPAVVGDVVHIFAAQLELGLVATPYIETGATTAQAGILENTPRLDYSGGATCPSLLLEPSRTNNIQYSENITSSWWLLSNVTTLDNQGISPEGLNNAGKITLTSTGGCVIYRTSLVIGDGVLSFFAKPETLSTGSRVRVSVDGVGEAYWNIDGTLNAVTGGTAENGESYGNGWFRFSYNVPSGSVANYGVQEGVIGDTMLVYGMQVEPNASYPTSYIPTYGTSQTRAFDNTTLGSLQTSSILNGTKGTLLFEGLKNGEPIFSNFVVTAQSNTNKSLLIDSIGSVIRLRVWNASSGVDATISTPSLSNGTFKYLIRWDNGDLKVFINGASVGTATINAYSYTTINLKEGTFSNNLVNQFLMFPTALTDSECIALTS